MNSLDTILHRDVFHKFTDCFQVEERYINILQKPTMFVILSLGDLLNLLIMTLSLYSLHHQIKYYIKI